MYLINDTNLKCSGLKISNENEYLFYQVVGPLGLEPRTCRL
jgi:hypothetical protein